MAARKRKRFFVDKAVQGRLVVRAGIYWLFCILSIVTFTACWIALTEEPANSNELFTRLQSGYAPAFFASMIMLPIVLYDVLRFSNRFAGPLKRMRLLVKALADGEPADPIRIREGDFWKDFADDFNRLAERVNQMQEPVAATPAGTVHGATAPVPRGCENAVAEHGAASALTEAVR
jgi:hypothetical protein